jgi:Holliday junction resolvase RusA-like endonuclease
MKYNKRILVPAKSWQEVVFIEGEVASSKNSRQLKMRRNRKNGKKYPTSIPSLFAKKYMKSAYLQMLEFRQDWLHGIKDKCSDLPLEVGFYFYRKTNGKADYSNLVQAVQDCMVWAGYITDDNMKCLEPVFLGFEKRDYAPGVSLFL